MNNWRIASGVSKKSREFPLWSLGAQMECSSSHRVFFFLRLVNCWYR